MPHSGTDSTYPTVQFSEATSDQTMIPIRSIDMGPADQEMAATDIPHAGRFSPLGSVTARRHGTEVQSMSLYR